jgi:hypothetical protein
MGTLNAVIEQAEDAAKAVLMDVRERVSQGVAFSAPPTRLFTSLSCAWCAPAGRRHFDRSPASRTTPAARRMRSKIVAALTYPIIMLSWGRRGRHPHGVQNRPEITDVLLKQTRGAALPRRPRSSCGLGMLRSYW